jgi:hypothetical protein
LASITKGFGGNEPLFLLFKEYNIHMEKDIYKRYNSRAAKWYRAKHLSVLDGVIYTDQKPVKDFKEGYERTKAAMKNMTKKSEKIE